MKIFNFYEDVLSSSWDRYYHEIEAETLEEAIEKVKDGEGSCYNSEHFYESSEEVTPEKNNGSATREIYYENELIWDNTETINRSDVITRNIKNISNQLFYIMASEPECLNLECVSFALVKKVLNQLEWNNDDIILSDKDFSYSCIFKNPKRAFCYIVRYGSYFGDLSIEKKL